MKFFYKLRLVLHYLKNSWTRVDYQLEHTLSNPSEADKAMLALGRWEYFKQSQAPSFTVGLDSDSECYLNLHATQKITGTITQLNGDQALVRTQIMIKTIQDCQAAGKRITDYLQAL
jgi:hypothetical protein